MKSIQILKTHKISVAMLADKLNISRQHVYRLLKDYDKGIYNSRNAEVDWSLNYLFKEKCNTYEFIDRLSEVEYRINNANKIGKEASKEACNIGNNKYIVKRYIKNFEYKNIEKNMYELKINDTDVYILHKEQLKGFLFMFGL